MDEAQLRLVTGALESGLVTITYIPSQGWSCTVRLRRQFEQWAEARTDRYTHLSTDELLTLLEVVMATLAAALGG